MTMLNAQVVTDALPFMLAIIMAGMGMTLKVSDFLRLLETPRSVLSILTVQVIGLPLLGLALASAMSLPPALAVGLVLLTACPGGTTSNLFTFLARGNLALSVSLTSLAGVITVFSLPLWVNLAVNLQTQGDANQWQLPFIATMQTLFLYTLLPVLLGMKFQRLFPLLADQIQKFLNRAALFFMVGLTAGLIINEYETFRTYFIEIGVTVGLLNALAIGMGAVTAAWFRLAPKDSTTAMLEVGIQNSAMAMVIANSLMGDPEVAIPAGIYSFSMYAFGFFVVSIRRPSSPKPSFPQAQKNSITDL